MAGSATLLIYNLPDKILDFVLRTTFKGSVNRDFLDLTFLSKLFMYVTQ